MQLLKDPRKLLRRDMEENRIGKDPVEALRRQVEGEEVLQKDLRARHGSRHFDEPLCAVESHGVVPQRTERQQVAAGAAAKVEDRERGRSFDAPEKGLDVL